MDPISMGLGIVGLGMSIAGAIGSSSDAHKSAALSQQISANSQDVAKQEQQQEALRQRSMELSNHRQSIESVRNLQRARAMSLTTAVGQGAQFGSVLAGAYGQASGAANTNLLGLSNGLEIGRANFAATSRINQDKISTAGIQGQQAQVQADAATWSAIGGVGGSVMKMGPTISNLSGISTAPAQQGGMYWGDPSLPGFGAYKGN